MLTPESEPPSRAFAIVLSHRPDLPDRGRADLGKFRSYFRSRAGWLALLRVAVAVGLIAALAATGRLGLDRLAALPLSDSLGILIAILLGSMLLPVVRWWLLLRVQGVGEPFGRVLRLTWAGYFASLLLPGGAGGDIARAILINRHRAERRARAFSTVLADREQICGNDLPLRTVAAAAATEVQEQLSLRGQTTAIVQQCLDELGGNVLAVAARLRIGKSTIYRMIQQRELHLN